MLKTIILAAGSGTRMNSKLPKVLQKINNKFIASYVIESALKINSEVTVVVGHQGELVEQSLSNYNIKFVYQKEQKGTGHAVSMVSNFIDDDNVLVLCGDIPLISSETLEKLVEQHIQSNNSATAISVKLNDSTSYGRILREQGQFVRIIEQKDCTETESLIKEINTGVYCFKGKDLNEAIKFLKNDNVQGELYLTDTLEILKNMDKKVSVELFENPEEFLGINDKIQLMTASKIMQKKINHNFMKKGVNIIDSNTAYISGDAVIGIDTIIMPNTIIEGSVVIGEDCIIGPNTTITETIVGNNVKISNSVVTTSSISDYTTVGPFAYVRPNSNIGSHVKIGDFVEVKNSTIGDNTKISHLSYIGDSDLGNNINIGCGTITVNYDGKNKFRTTIEDNVFVGCNSNLIAPVTLQNNSFVAAGTTVTKDIPPKSLAIGRQRQTNKENYVK